jgi:hypothetical protein
MRLAYKNIVDGLVASQMTALTTLTNYPITNVQDERLMIQYASDSGSSQSATFTLPIYPEYPDNITATSYIQTVWATTDGWTANVSAPSIVSNGELYTTSVQNGVYKTGFSDLQGKRVIVKVKSVTGGNHAISKKVGTVWSVINNTTLVSNVSTLIDVTLSSGSVIDGIALGAASIDYRWSGIYMGTGLYDTLVPDQSENDNDLTNTGVLPVNNVANPGFYFNGVNSYLSGTIADFNFTGAFEFNVKVEGKVRTGTQTLFSRDSGSAPNRGIYIYLSNNLPVMSLSADGSATVVTVSSLAGNECTTNCILSFKFVPGVGLYIYKNKILITSNLVSPPSQVYYSTSQPLRFGSLATVNIFSGILNKIKLYARNLSDSERANIVDSIPFSTEKDGLVAHYELDKDYKINTVSLLGHNIKSGTVVKVIANNSDNWNSPSLSEVFTYVNSEKALLKFFSSTYVYKYWKFSIVGQASIQIGRVWLGEYLTIDPSSLLDFIVTKARDDNVVYGRGRQKFASPGVKWREFELSFPDTKYSMIKQIEDMYDEVGNYKSLIFCNFDTIRDYQIVEPCYCSIEGNLALKHSRSMKFGYSLLLKENK